MKYRLFCAAAALGAVFCCGMIPEAILAKTPAVEVAAVEAFEVQPEISCTGVIEAENSCRLMAVSGVVMEELLVTEGSLVEAGTPLARVRPQSSVESPFLICDPQQSGAVFGGYSSEQLAALAALQGVDPSMVPEDLEQLTEGLSQLSQWEMPSEEIISAPVSGKVTQLTVKEGQYLGPGESLCTILGNDSYLATVQVPADEVDKISLGDTAEISGGEINDQHLSGLVCQISSTVSKSLQGPALVSMVDVGVRVYPQQGQTIRHGAGIQCRILTGEPRQCLTVPYECVQQDDQNQEFVFLVSQQGLSAVPVTTGEELAERVEVSGSLNPGDLLAVTGEIPEQYLLTKEGD